MKNVLLTCGAENADCSQDRWNRSPMDAALRRLLSADRVHATYIEEGDRVEEQQAKFRHAER